MPGVLLVAFVVQIFAIKIFDTWILIFLPMLTAFLKNSLKGLYLMMTDIFLVLLSNLVTDIVLRVNPDSLLSWFLLGKF